MFSAIASGNRALLGRRGSIVGEGARGGGACGVDVGCVAVGVGGLELVARGRIEGADLLSRAAHGLAGNEHLSRQVSVGHRGSHGFLGLWMVDLVGFVSGLP
jgi:hypothetical protein